MIRGDAAFVSDADRKRCTAGAPYDWALLIGGWNSDGIKSDEIQTIFPDLFLYCGGGFNS